MDCCVQHAAGSQSVLARLALSRPPNELPADVFVFVVSWLSCGVAFWRELRSAVVSCLGVISEMDEISRFVPPCSPFLSRSLRILSLSS